MSLTHQADLPAPRAAATTYWLRTYLVDTTTGSWTEQGAAVKADASPVARTLPAGVYRFAMFANNTNGDGPDSDLTDPVTVGEWGAEVWVRCRLPKGWHGLCNWTQQCIIMHVTRTTHTHLASTPRPDCSNPALAAPGCQQVWQTR